MTNELHILTEYSPFSMGFVLITKKGRAIVIDGGRSEELHNIVRHVGDRKIAMWILTHPHGDHLGALNSALKKESPLVAASESFVLNFAPYDFYLSCGCSAQELAPLFEFDSRAEKIKDRIKTVSAGDKIEVDGLKIEFLFSRKDSFKENAVNDSSLVFRIRGEKKTVLFLADLGPAAGDFLLETYGDKLKSDVVQMAHHGHMCVGKEVYKAISPEICIWCAASWLYNEPDKEIRPRMYGVGRTRKWMEELNFTNHIVTKDGDQIIFI